MFVKFTKIHLTSQYSELISRFLHFFPLQFTAKSQISFLLRFFDSILIFFFRFFCFTVCLKHLFRYMYIMHIHIFGSQKKTFFSLLLLSLLLFIIRMADFYLEYCVLVYIFTFYSCWSLFCITILVYLWRHLLTTSKITFDVMHSGQKRSIFNYFFLIFMLKAIVIN